MSAGWLWVTRGEMDELIWVEPVLLPRLVTLTLGPGVSVTVSEGLVIPGLLCPQGVAEGERLKSEHCEESELTESGSVAQVLLVQPESLTSYGYFTRLSASSCCLPVLNPLKGQGRNLACAFLPGCLERS